MKTVRLTDRMFEGAVSLERGEAWVKPWRLPVAEKALFAPDDALPPRAEMPAGVRLRFATDARTLQLEVAPFPEPRSFDVTSEGKLLASVRIDSGAMLVTFDALPPGTRTLELWLPPFGPVTLHALRVDSGATVRTVPDDRPKWITYGSSITMCRTAHSPARTWPAVVARKRNLNLTCLGYGGQCHLDPMVARMIRDLPADVITLKLGINIQGGSTLSPRTFRPAVLGFVKILREKHRTIPIGVVSPIISPPRETVPNSVGLSLSQMRLELQDAVQRLRACGDAHVHYFDGLKVFGESLVADYLPDLLHPSGDGYEKLGANFARVVFDRLR